MKQAATRRPLRRGLSLLLCASLSLALLGCARETPAAAQPEVTAAPTTASTTAPTEANPIEAAITAAQSYIAQENYAAAADVLDQALETETDERISELLAEIDELAATPLDMVLSQDASALKTGYAEVQSISAVLRRDGAVRFSIEYTADPDMQFQIEGAGLHYISDFSLTGTPFVFEIDAPELQAIGRTFKVFLGRSQGDSLYVNVFVNFPDDVRNGSATVLTLEPEEIRSNGCQINSITAQPVDEDRIYCSLTYTAPQPGMEIYLCVGDRDPYLVNWTDSGRRQDSFLVSRKAVPQGEKARLVIATDSSLKTGAAVSFSPEEVTLPEHFQADILREVQDIPYGSNIRTANIANDGKYQIHSVSAQLLQSGMVLYQVAYTLPEETDQVSVGAFAFLNGTNKGYPILEETPLTWSDTVQFYMPLEDVQNTEEVLLSLGDANAWEFLELRISNAWCRDITEGTPVGDPVEAAFTVMEQPRTGDYAFRSCTAQRLNNGYVRLTLCYTAPEERTAYLMSTNRALDINCSSGGTSGTHTVTVDIPPSAPLSNGILGFRCNWDQGAQEGLLSVDIDLSDFYGGEGQGAPPIELRRITSENSD